MTNLFVFAVCLLSSTVGGVCGIGGGVVIKPVLDATGIMSVSCASFLSGLTVIAMSLVSVYKNRKTRELDPVRSVPIGLGAAVGGVLGKRLFQMLKTASGNERMVGFVQAVLLGALVLGTLIYVLNKQRIRTLDVRGKMPALFIGFALGVLSSFLGIGGGPMNLAVLYFFFSMTTKQATINSLVVVLISQLASLMTTLVGGNVPAFEMTTLWVMVLAGVGGGLISARLHRRLNSRQTERLFAGLLCVILMICVYNAGRAI